MNEVIKALIERRSIRKFTAEPVSEADLNLIIKAATYAPTARNTQAWHITVVKGLPNISKLNLAVKEASVKPGFETYKDFVSAASYSINYGGAPIFIIVGTDGAKTPCALEDGSLVLGNIFLAAHSLGLGTCWINQLGVISDEPGFRKVLNGLGFPATHKIVGSVALGHADGPNNPPAPPRKEGQINIVQ